MSAPYFLRSFITTWPEACSTWQPTACLFYVLQPTAQKHGEYEWIGFVQPFHCLLLYHKYLIIYQCELPLISLESLRWWMAHHMAFSTHVYPAMWPCGATWQSLQPAGVKSDGNRFESSPVRTEPRNVLGCLLPTSVHRPGIIESWLLIDFLREPYEADVTLRYEAMLQVTAVAVHATAKKNNNPKRVWI